MVVRDEWVPVPPKEVDEAAKNGNRSAKQALKKASFYSDKDNYNIEFLRAGARFKVRTKKFNLFD